jgi:hypothetical protein
VSEEEAVAWIKDNNKDINPNEWRVRFYEKLGIEKQLESESNLEEVDQFENDKYYINFFSQRTSQNIRNRYLSRLMISETSSEPPRKKDQHSTSALIQSSSSIGTIPSYAPATSAPTSSSTSGRKPRRFLRSWTSARRNSCCGPGKGVRRSTS